MANLLNRINKWGFLHIPKTGGSSIQTKLALIKGTYPISRSHDPIGNFQNINDYFIFCFVRNPFYQVISAFLHTNRELNDSNLPKEKFNEYNVIDNKLKLIDFMKQVDSGGTYISKTQSWQIYYGQTPQKKVSFIGRYENFKKDTKFIFDKINVDSELLLTNYNTITSKYIIREEIYKQHYADQWMIDWVLDRYKEDFENFGYDKKL